MDELRRRARGRVSRARRARRRPRRRSSAALSRGDQTASRRREPRRRGRSRSGRSSLHPRRAGRSARSPPVFLVRRHRRSAAEAAPAGRPAARRRRVRPPGDGQEHDDDVANATDGDPVTYWETEEYAEPAFGTQERRRDRLRRGPRRLAETIVMSASGSRASCANPGGLVSDQPRTSRRRRSSVAGGRRSSSRGRARAAYYLLWITQLSAGPATREPVNEVTASDSLKRLAAGHGVGVATCRNASSGDGEVVGSTRVARCSTGTRLTSSRLSAVGSNVLAGKDVAPRIVHASRRVRVLRPPGKVAPTVANVTHRSM